jgi:hypothetical protein
MLKEQFNGNVLITLAGSDHKQLFELNENRYRTGLLVIFGRGYQQTTCLQRPKEGWLLKGCKENYPGLNNEAFITGDRSLATGIYQVSKLIMFQRGKN